MLLYLDLYILTICESCLVVSDSLQPHGLYSTWSSPGQNTGVGSLFLLQGIFPTQGSNSGLLHCRQILYQLSYQGSHISCITDLLNAHFLWSKHSAYISRTKESFRLPITAFGSRMTFVASKVLLSKNPSSYTWISKFQNQKGQSTFKTIMLAHYSSLLQSSESQFCFPTH